MSIRVMAQVWEDDRIGRNDILVALALADHADDRGTCYPSIDRIAQRARVTRRSTMVSLRRLEEQGVISVQFNAGPHGTNIYTIGGQTLPGAKIARGQNRDAGLPPNRKEPSVPTSTRARFKPPTADEVRAWADANGVDPRHADEFCDHFEANGWRVGSGSGKPMKSWHAAYRNWVRREPKFRNDNGKTTGRLTARQTASLSVEELARAGGYIH